MTFINGEVTRGSFRSAAREYLLEAKSANKAVVGINDAINNRFRGNYDDAVRDFYAAVFRTEQAPDNKSTLDLIVEIGKQNPVAGTALVMCEPKS